MAKSTSVRLPKDLIDALERRAAAEGVTRSRLIIRAVEQALAEQSTWSPGFLKAITSPRPELDEAVDELMDAIRERRSRSEAPAL